ncbi:MAG TPA: hypothetical protein VEV44_15785 [Pseudoneobacillus sp.]|nr:hypothetical protein [Pseudoneobacillus sp.]
MSNRLAKQPLLYIQQPVLESQVAPMQQFFIIKNRNSNPTINDEAAISEAKTNIEQPVQRTNEIPLEANDNHELVVSSVSMSVPTQVEEIEEPSIMEFILEKIFTPEENAYVLDEMENNMVKEIRDLKVNFKEPVIEKATIDKSKNKSNKRIPFDKLPLNEKVKQLKITPPMKIKYRFITTDAVYLGYFRSVKNDLIEIDSITNNIIQKIEFPADNLIDILLFGL